MLPGGSPGNKCERQRSEHALYKRR